LKAVNPNKGEWVSYVTEQRQQAECDDNSRAEQDTVSITRVGLLCHFGDLMLGK